MTKHAIRNENSREILAEIIDFTVDAIISLDSNHNIVLVNEAFENIFGYKEEEVLGKSLNILLPKPIHTIHADFIHKYEASSQKARYMGERSDLFGINKNGDKVPLDISIQKHPEGSLCRYTAICRDISNRLKQEKRIKEEEKKFRTLFNTSDHYTILLDGECEVREFNDTALQLAQSEPEKYIGKKIWDCNFWADEMDYSLIHNAVLKVKAEKPRKLIVNAFGINKRKLVLEITLTLIRDDNKKSTLIVMEGKNITDIIESHKALKESESRLSRAQRIAKLGNWEWTIASNEMSWSDEIYNIFGLSKGSFYPNYDDFLKNTHEDDRNCVDAAITQALKNDQTFNVTHRIVLPDGSEKNVESLGEIFRMKDGTPIRVEGTMQDVTVSWKREEELRKAKSSAEEANIAKAQFLSTVSHELKTPLNAIIGFSTMIAEEHVGKINVPYYKDYATYINSSGNALLSLIENILHVTSFELGSVKYEPSLFFAQSLVDNVMNLMYNRALEKSIDIQFSMSEDVHDIYLDFRHMKRVLMHLIDNAIKFSKTNDTIEVNLYLKNDNFMIDVIDHGVGFDYNDKEKIFGLFVQKDMNHNRMYGGVGLGLAIVKNLVELQGGTMDVESKAGEGSCFSVCFAHQGMQEKLQKNK
ncbi:MAG: PAS domain S-box protein [Emcibacter sp.]|nr:PAS domain S-box protein [Emcibacter sp.]